MRRHPRRAEVDPYNPHAWATSDRTGFVGNHRDLRWQHEWAGLQLVNLRVLVFADEYDKPNPQLRTIILPPDPLPIPNARPEPYAIEEQTIRVIESGVARLQMNGVMRLESNLQGTTNAGTYPG